MGSRKRILVSINTSWNIYNFRRNLIDFLSRNGMDIVLCAPQDKYTQKLIDLGYEFHPIKLSQKGKNPLEDLNLLLQYKRIIKKNNIDLCLFYTIKPNIFGSLAAGILKVPYINNISGLGTVFLRNSLSYKIARNLYKTALRKSSLVFFQNESDRQVFLNRKMLTERLTQIIPGSGIDTQYFKQKAQKKDMGTFTFLMISRLIFDKGIREFIEASKIVSEKDGQVNFEIIGKSEEEAGLGYSKEEMKKICKGKNIHWYDEQEDVRPFIEKANVVVLPSYREGLSRALLEASSMQTPIITTNVPGCRELVINNQNGLICNVRDPEDLASKMIEIRKCSARELAEMGENARKMVQGRYEDKIIFESYLNAITDKLN